MKFLLPVLIALSATVIAGGRTGRASLQPSPPYTPNTPDDPAVLDSLPYLQLLDKNAEMGLISPDSVVSAPLRLTNIGSQPLVITSIHTDCGCTTAARPDEPLAPGDTLTLTVRFDPRGRVPGDFRKIIRIRSNAANTMAVAFARGRIRRPLHR